MMQVNSKTLGKLVQAGFIAGFRGYTSESQTIFEGVHAIRPDNVDILIGLAVSMANNFNHSEAIWILEKRVLVQEPENGTAKCFLGWIYIRAGREVDGKRLLQEVIDSKDTENETLARSFLTDSETTVLS